MTFIVQAKTCSFLSLYFIALFQNHKSKDYGTPAYRRNRRKHTSGNIRYQCIGEFIYSPER